MTEKLFPNFLAVAMCKINLVSEASKRAKCETQAKTRGGSVTILFPPSKWYYHGTVGNYGKFQKDVKLFLNHKN